MNIILINPEFPDTFWSFRHALKFVGKRSALPPLGLLTIAAMLPREWHLRLVDTNVCELTNADIDWADCAFVSAMIIQRKTARSIINRCSKAGLRVVAGGPLFYSEYEQFNEVDHFILNEAELTLPPFLDDLQKGTLRRVYSTGSFANMLESPVPRWDLLDLRRYASMSIQFSRGCPFDCDFCNVTALLGHQVRIKSSAQIIDELESLNALGWRGAVFFVDDNFIGNKAFLKNDLLPALIEWRKDRRENTFLTETSINLADDESLMALMTKAGFGTVFIGIETPDDESLAECSKLQNKNRNLVEDVKRIQRSGLEVQGGFIVGFDHDGPSIFERQIEFIQKSGIVTAMVGLLQAPPGTRLYARLKCENRLSSVPSGDNVDGTTNIIPAMSLNALKNGYRQILDHIYSPAAYYERIRTFLNEYRMPRLRVKHQFSHIMAAFRSLYYIGIAGSERVYYWKLLLWTLIRHPRLLSNAITLAIYGYHFRIICERHVV